MGLHSHIMVELVKSKTGSFWVYIVPVTTNTHFILLSTVSIHHTKYFIEILPRRHKSSMTVDFINSNIHGINDHSGLNKDTTDMPLSSVYSRRKF